MKCFNCHEEIVGEAFITWPRVPDAQHLRCSAIFQASQRMIKDGGRTNLEKLRDLLVEIIDTDDVQRIVEGSFPEGTTITLTLRKGIALKIIDAWHIKKFGNDNSEDDDCPPPEIVEKNK